MKNYDYNLVNPNISNFINSIRDIGYNCNIVISDLLDNCLDAGARSIEIIGLVKPEIFLEILDDGYCLVLTYNHVKKMYDDRCEDNIL